MKPVKHVMLVGGGTAGWLTAAFLAQALGSKGDDGVAVTVVESSDIGIIGVGEGSFPSLRGTLSAIGIDEARFVRECNATFKQGVKFANWARPPGAQGADHYFHPFSAPSQRPGGPELLPYWLQGAARPSTAFAAAATMQKRVADASHAPKRTTDGDFLGPMNYAYHFDAGLLAKLLADQAKTLGVKHILATIERVVLSEDGGIDSLVTKESGTLSADLYIDCTGFRSALISQLDDGAHGSSWRSLEDVLFVDRALAMQVPYAEPDAPIPSYTVSTAHEAGWTWDIGLHERRGIGYVYSSRHSDEAEAERVLRRYIGPAAEKLEPRLLKLKVGYRDVQWIKNCVAVGLSSGFLEPLESSGIGLIETAAYLIAHMFPHDGNLAPAAKQFNALMKVRYERIVDFIKMHYCLTKRRDTPFWIDNADPRSIPDSLQEKLAMWRCRPPHRLDFVADHEMYPATSWQYVLYGMEFDTAFSGNRTAFPRFDEARKEFQTIEQLALRAIADLPPHRTLVEAMCERQAMPAKTGTR